MFNRKSGGDANELKRSLDENKELIAQKVAEVKEAETALRLKLGSIGNLVHDSVPVDNNEVSSRTSCLLGCPCAG